MPFAHLIGVEPQALSVLRSVHMERDRDYDVERESADEVPALVGPLGNLSDAGSSGASSSSLKTTNAVASSLSTTFGSGCASPLGATTTTIAGLPSAAYHCLTNQNSLLALQGGTLPGKLLWGNENKLPVIDLFRILLLLGVLPFLFCFCGRPVATACVDSVPAGGNRT